MCGLDSFFWALGHVERQARPEELLQEASSGTGLRGAACDHVALQKSLWLCMKSILSIAGSKLASTTIITSGSAATISSSLTQAQLFSVSSAWAVCPRG